VAAAAAGNVGRTTHIAMNVPAPKLVLPSTGAGTLKVNQAAPSTIATIPVLKPSSSVSGYISKPIIPPSLPKQPESDENSIAVSELSESEISSPKIAMAVYESWQSPVLDDPLIGGDIGSGTQSVKTASSPAKNSSHEESHVAPRKQHKSESNLPKSRSNRTDMHLIPPFPSTNSESKDGSLQDLKIPVLPVH
jgi:hypothetical protein